MQKFSVMVGLAAVLAGPYGPASAQDLPAIPTFVEEGGSAGVASVYAGDWEYMVGGGVATFDCSGDGKADLLLAGGKAPATFYRNTSVIGGALSFLPEVSGLELDAVTGTYPLDIDSDGVTDLVLLRQGENVRIVNRDAADFVNLVQHVQEILFRINPAAVNAGHDFADNLLPGSCAGLIFQSL